MPISYQYKLKETEEAIGLNALDEECCAYFELEVDEKNFCGPFLDLRAFAHGVAYNEPNNIATSDSIKRGLQDNNGEWEAHMLYFFNEFLANRYTYNEWR